MFDREIVMVEIESGIRHVFDCGKGLLQIGSCPPFLFLDEDGVALAPIEGRLVFCSREGARNAM